jgi:hypothetical protein
MLSDVGVSVVGVWVAVATTLGVASGVTVLLAVSDAVAFSVGEMTSDGIGVLKIGAAEAVAVVVVVTVERGSIDVAVTLGLAVGAPGVPSAAGVAVGAVPPAAPRG